MIIKPEKITFAGIEIPIEGKKISIQGIYDPDHMSWRVHKQFVLFKFKQFIHSFLNTFHHSC
jgi:hypothetical protein